MPNSILRETLNIDNDLVVNGNIYFVKKESLLSEIDNLETYEPISGSFENLEINGNLIVCEFIDNLDVEIKGTIRSVGNIVYE